MKKFLFMNFLKFKLFLIKLRHYLELFLVKIFIFFLSKLSINKSSKFCGKILEFIGPYLKTHKLAYNNIKISFPNKDDIEIKRDLKNMWNNLGRIIGEFSHINSLSKEYIRKHVIIDKETHDIINDIKNNNKANIIFTAHYGNWEMGIKLFNYYQTSHKIAILYRQLNNIYLDDYLSKYRKIKMIMKNKDGYRDIISYIKKGYTIIIMADQYITSGTSVDFLGRKARTTNSISKIAKKYNLDIISAISVRDNKDKDIFNIKFSKLPYNNEDKIYDITKKINQKIEEYIKKDLTQWFWVHNRWK